MNTINRSAGESFTLGSKVVVVTGATASGKSDLAERIASAFGGEIINSDSMQIYRGLDIGTAKPSIESRRRIPHHLFDIADPDQDFTAADFSDNARQIISDILSRNRLPVVVGGTGLYIRALFSGLADVPGADISARFEYLKMAENHGNDYLHECLRMVDPVSADRIHPNNIVRIIRALEVYNTSGKSISEFQFEHRFKENWCQTVKIAVDLDREELYDRINRRVDMMIESGLVQEVESLLSRGLSPNLKSLSSIGYKEICGYLAGTLTFSDAVLQIKANSRRYAKRQLTWFRKDPEIKWFKSPIDIDEILDFTDYNLM